MNTPDSFSELVSMFINFINMLIPILFAFTILYLSWGVINAWIINGGEQGAVDKGKKVAIAGVVALVIMIGIWGILEILQKSLRLD